jgi:glutaminyl-tRNA synthetase
VSNFLEKDDVPTTTNDFIRSIIREDLKVKKNSSRVATRFPPEPNGYLHLGSAKAISINYGIAKEFGGTFNLRFDDTDPLKEKQEFIDSIIEDVAWLGAKWDGEPYYTSDYFDKLFDCAIELIRRNKAYVCSLPAEQIKEYRGTLTEPGRNSPFRDRSPMENEELFLKMRAGDFQDGACVLRAKIDMSSPNLNLRDPVIYRIKHLEHPKAGNRWCIYPMYDYSHPISDAIEGITHSLCSFEFEDHRPLYDWVIDNLEHLNFPSRPRQIEFAKLSLTYVVIGKRFLGSLIKNGLVSGWDDPQLLTVSGMRRRGYTPEAINEFCRLTGISKANSTADFEMLEYCLRDDLKLKTLRKMVVLDPIKVVITNLGEDESFKLVAENNAEAPELGERELSFSRELFIERSDFLLNPPRKFFRLTLGGNVRLKHGFIITCNDVVKDKNGEITELHCTYDPRSKSGSDESQLKVKGTIHWVNAQDCVDLEVTHYDYLFPKNLNKELDFMEQINRDSKTTYKHAKGEASLKEVMLGERFQFLRHGYYYFDPLLAGEVLKCCQIVGLKDGWSKIVNKT